jgi:hypothetical protein
MGDYRAFMMAAISHANTVELRCFADWFRANIATGRVFWKIKAAGPKYGRYNPAPCS